MVGLRDPRFAASNFQMRGQTLDSIPRHKFMFWVRFVTNDTSGAEVGKNSRWPNGVSFKVMSADRPKITYKSTTLNQYNKKRVVQTGVEYQPVTIRFYDTYDDELLKLVKDYSSFYYGDFNNPDSKAWAHDVTDGNMNMGVGFWGFLSNQSNNPEDTYYFDRVEIYTFGNNEYTRWDLVKPKIVDFSPDSMDYADNAPSAGSITLAYEGVIWPKIGEKLTNGDIEMMGLDQGEYGEFNQDHLTFPTTPENVAAAANRLAAATNGSSATYFDAMMTALRQEQAQGSSGSGISLPSSLISAGSALGLDFGSGGVSSILNQIGNLGGVLQGAVSQLSSSGVGGLINSVSGLLGNNISSTLSNALGKLTSATSALGGLSSGLGSLTSSMGNIGSMFNSGGLSSMVSGLTSSLGGMGGGSLTSAFSGLTSGLSGLTSSISSITSSASGLLGSARGLLGGFGGFFSDDDFTEEELLVLAKPVTAEAEKDYFLIVDAAIAAGDVFRIMFKYDLMPRKVKDALDDISASAHPNWLIVGRTPMSQMYDKIKSLGQHLTILSDYVYGVQQRASNSNAAYDSAKAKAEAMGLKDPTLSNMAARSIMERSKQAGANLTDYRSNTIEPAVYNYMNKNMGTEIQIGKMNESVLYKSGNNPIQRALQRQTVVQTDYHVYLDAGINPDLLDDTNG